MQIADIKKIIAEAHASDVEAVWQVAMCAEDNAVLRLCN